MNVAGIKKVLEEVGVRTCQVHARNVQCSCFLAPWRRGHRSGSDSTPSMGIAIADRGRSMVHCFACGFGGTLIQAVSLYGASADVDVRELVRAIAKAEEGDPDAIVATLVGLPEEPTAPIQILGEDFLDQFEVAGHQYLVDRGIEVETQKAWGVRWDVIRNRVVVPVRTPEGELVGAVGRLVVDGLPKYWNYGNFPKARTLFGFHMRRGPAAVVVEGPLDALMVWQALRECPQYSVVALMGSEASRTQVQLLVDQFEEVFLFMDFDPAGLTASRRIGELLRARVPVRYVRYAQSEYGEDPASLVRSGCSIMERMEQAQVLN